MVPLLISPHDMRKHSTVSLLSIGFMLLAAVYSYFSYASIHHIDLVLCFLRACSIMISLPECTYSNHRQQLLSLFWKILRASSCHHLVLLTLPLRHTPLFSMVVSDIPKCWCFVHSYNARPKKGKLFL